MNKQIIIPSPENFEKIILNFKNGGVGKIHIISDFDRTLTYNKVNGEERPSLISILRRQNILGEKYTKKAYDLYNYYEPIENNPNISLEKKKQEMTNWWNKHLTLLIETGLYKNDIEKAINSGNIKLRKGVDEFLKFLSERGIPFIIMSANVLGVDSIKMFLEQQGLYFSNIFIESNSFVWDKNGKAISYGNPVIHTFNKDEKSLSLEIYERVKNRTNVILLGDSLGDIGMAKGFPYKNLLKVGFLNKNVEENLEEYKKNFDMIILNDGNFDGINEVLRGLIGK